MLIAKALDLGRYPLETSTSSNQEEDRWTLVLRFMEFRAFIGFFGREFMQGLALSTLQIFDTGGNNTMEADVYTLGTDKWRNIGVVPQYNSGRRPIQMCAFDFEMEKFRSLGLPQIFEYEIYLWIEIGVHGESLYICCCNRLESNLTKIWLMKEYGVEGFWIKMLVMDFKMRYCHLWHLQGIEYWLENGNVLLNDGIVVSKPSFASLEDVVGDSSRVLKGFTWDH
ncbi:unnamed protein product [Dovyalis caffra]|uniref:F-box associated domain-containing protein n=1 Tax=Dovyalis caffra TaxID=77055 RepID=A0AAV1QQ95_9ROSI|nr:unnamed protein product [Dovyalis caffra]